MSTLDQIAMWLGYGIGAGGALVLLLMIWDRVFTMILNELNLHKIILQFAFDRLKKKKAEG